MKPTLMLIGLGDLGGVILELLAREAWLGRIVAADREVERGLDRCNLARVGAVAQGHAPKIDFVALDLNERGAVSETVRRQSPDLILSTATMLTWWLPNLLPREAADRIKSAGFGVWLPVHFSLTRKLMEALRAAEYHGHVLTAPFPDVVNCILGKLGLAPTCGIGNLDEIVPKVRLLAAQRLDVEVEHIGVVLVAHHALRAAVFGGTFGERDEEIPPYFLRVQYEGQDVTAEVDADELLVTPYRLPAGSVTHFLTAGCTVRLVRTLLTEDEAFLHVPAPNGLPGGYPVLAGRDGVRPAPIDGLSLAEAIDINERSHRFDGIERIERDGTAVFDARVAEVMRETLGYDCERMAPSEADRRAGELVARFKEYARKLGTEIP